MTNHLENNHLLIQNDSVSKEVLSGIRLVALDLDGTLFNNNGIITDATKTAIQNAAKAGIHIIISTGRPFNGIPFEQIKDTGIRYAITANGSGIYEIDSQTSLFESCLPNEVTFPILDFLNTKEVHMDAFIDGKGVSPYKCIQTGRNLPIPKHLIRYIVDSRIRVDDLKEYLTDNHLEMQKMTINFLKAENGVLKYREEVKSFLSANPHVNCVSGGYNNLEFTRADVNKGVGLHQIAQYLHIDANQTMAIGDTENDIEILKAATVGVAMANATDAVKEIADVITLSNENDGVAVMLNQLLHLS